VASAGPYASLHHASTPPLSFSQAGCPSCRQTNSVKAPKATAIRGETKIIRNTLVLMSTKKLRCRRRQQLRTTRKWQTDNVHRTTRKSQTDNAHRNTRKCQTDNVHWTTRKLQTTYTGTHASARQRTLDVDLYDDVIAPVAVARRTLVVSLVRLPHVLDQQLRVVVIHLVAADRQASVHLDPRQPYCRAATANNTANNTPS